jgi:hypothetical protein
MEAHRLVAAHNAMSNWPESRRPAALAQLQTSADAVQPELDAGSPPYYPYPVQQQNSGLVEQQLSLTSAIMAGLNAQRERLDPDEEHLRAQNLLIDGPDQDLSIDWKQPVDQLPQPGSLGQPFGIPGQGMFQLRYATEEELAALAC